MSGEKRAFARVIGIDYSGAETANSSLKGLRVYMADVGEAPREVPPPLSPKRYWTRRGVAEWLVKRLAEDIPTVVGIDRAFSFPLRYFEVHGLLPDWPSFLEDFQLHWPTDADNISTWEPDYFRCLIPRFDGAILSREWKEALWDKFVTGAPRPRSRSELQYSDRKLRSRS